ncbi:ATP-dependent RecD-like DNA helicase [Ruminococcaceae bacterium OttesenSCG-928-I18]|nr:ATP-dependent RecD-like DNA helicase [Ruminococcaceae bacterium OttesenSCG-928-I18]
MQQETEVLVGRVESVSFESEDSGFAVLQLVDGSGDLVCAVGSLAGSVPGEELTLQGRFVQHPAYGPQFEAVSCAFRLPEEEGAVLQYLSSGVLPGIGPATARRIVEKFGAGALEILANDPEKLASVRGFSEGKAREAGRRFLELYGVREAMAALSGLGLTASEAVAVYRHYETAALRLIEENPYRLCGYPLFISFSRADAMAERLSIDRESKERVRAAILYTLRHNLNNGHTCLPRESLLATVVDFFSLPPEDVERELDLLCEEGQLQAAEEGAGEAIFLAEMFRAELRAASHLKELLSQTYPAPRGLDKTISGLEETAGIQYAEKQKEAIKLAMEKGILLITGGPGTGKTTTVNAVLALFEKQAERVLLAAPTGRAAKRMSELTGRKASTIHRLLEVDFSAGMEFPRFKYNEENQLRCDVMIIDEVSMVDALLFESLLLALKPRCRLILVGDADQLPSVGAGNVLRGILQSNVVPTVCLNEIFRQAAASLIVRNAHRIVEGQMPQNGGKKDDFFFLRAYGKQAQKLVCDLVANRLPGSYGYSPVEDIQVLCPGRKGPLGTEVLCAELQNLLNPPAQAKPELKRGASVFRVGDKVMQVKNNYDIPWTHVDGEPGAGAFNGDIGIIEEVDPAAGTMTVFSEDRHIYYTADNLRELELAYAVTIHKSQGSEFEAVVLSVSEVPKPLRYRNLLYTAVTRAKRLCVLVGEDETLFEMVQNAKRNTRFSGFAGFLQREDWL